MKLLDIVFAGTKARHEMRTMLDRAVTESRSLTIAEQVRFDSLGVRLAELDGELEDRRAMEQRLHNYVITLVQNGNAQ